MTVFTRLVTVTARPTETLPRREGARPRLRSAQWTTPTLLRALTVAVAVPALALLGVLAVAVSQARDGLAQIGHRDGPVVVSTASLYFALSDMDAQVANVLLVADRADLGINRPQALEIYERRRTEVAGYVQQTAALTGDDQAAGQRVRDLLNSLGRYESLAGQAILAANVPDARPGRPPLAALDLYRQATDLMHRDLLPTAQVLVDDNAQALENEYAAARASVTGSITWTAVLGIILLAVLAGLQVFLFRRHHRVVNPAVALATLVALAFVATGVSTLGTGRENLRAVKKDAFDSILALTQARAVSYDANADESRYLVDPDRAAQYEQAFADKSLRLARVDAAGVHAYDAALAGALDRYRAEHTVAFDGFYGKALRNITFVGEREAAGEMLARYQEYQRADRKIRALNTSGNLGEAIRFCVSFAPGDSNYLYDQYDQALGRFIGINQRAFEDSVRAGERNLSGWTWLPPAVLLGVMLLVFVGVRPRLSEYRP